MNKEELEKRLTEIDKHLDQAMANYNVLLGGKQELQYWLSQIKQEDEPTGA